MLKKVNKNGFTLIELLAVIVILGVIMMIAIPSMTETIENSKKDTIISSAREYVDGIYNLLLSENSLPDYGKAIKVPISAITLEKGGKSPFTSTAYDGTESFVVVVNTGTSNGTASSKYKYYVTLKDSAGNCLKLTDSDNLNGKAKVTRTYIASGTACAVSYSGTAIEGKTVENYQ